MLIAGKLREPHSAAPALARPRLIQRLEAAPAARLILVRAPAGYGKTILLEQCKAHLARHGIPHGWLSLDTGDRSPGSVHPYILAALKSAGFRFGAHVPQRCVALSTADPARAARFAVSELRPPTGSPRLLIDGIDFLGPGAGIEFVELLLRYVNNLQIVATTQRRPNLPLASLRAAGLLQEITSTELRFSIAEISALFDGLLPERYLRSLWARTDGVAAALSFARSTIGTTGSGSGVWTDWMEEYYREQILDALPSELQAIVSRLVIVERFDASLARAILGRDVRPEIQRLHREESLLTLEQCTGTFRFPIPLRESLVKRLQWSNEDEWKELHRRAMSWFRSRGLLQEALAHALAANEFNQAVGLFRNVGAWAMIVHQGVQSLRLALEQMQTASASDQALLAWSRVLLLTQQGRTKEACTIAAELQASSEGIARPGTALTTDAAFQRREIMLIETLLAAYADQRLPSERDQVLAAAAQQLPENEHLHQAFISNALCWLRCERAQFSAADVDAERAISEFTADDALYGSFFMHLHRIIIRFWQNRLEEAEAEAKLSARLQRLFFPSDGRLAWLSRVFEALVQFEVGRVETAATLLHGCLDDEYAAEGWLEAQLMAYALSARVAVAQGQLPAALAILAQGERLAEERRLPRLRWQLEFHRAHLLMQQNPGARLADHLVFHADSALDPEYFTWRERFQAAIITTRSAIEHRQFAGASALIGRMQREVDGIDVPRARVIVKILQARMRLVEGDRQAGASLILDAVRAFNGQPSVRLFEDEGIDISEFKNVDAEDICNVVPRASTELVPRENATELTPREREILELVARGTPNKVIAGRIGVSEGTVKFHLRNTYRKLKVRNRTQAVTRMLSD